MAVYLALFSVAGAMVLHGITQLAANGFRAALLWRHVHWPSLRWVALGMVAAIVVFAAAQIVLARATIMVVLGAIPLLAMVVPWSPPRRHRAPAARRSLRRRLDRCPTDSGKSPGPSSTTSSSSLRSTATRSSPPRRSSRAPGIWLRRFILARFSRLAVKRSHRGSTFWLSVGRSSAPGWAVRSSTASASGPSGAAAAGSSRSLGSSSSAGASSNSGGDGRAPENAPPRPTFTKPTSSE